MTAPALFPRFARWTADFCGRPSTFAVACVTVVAWALSGPFFRFSDTWQLIINTGTTIVTFLMIFLLQHVQNRDAAALGQKLDALLAMNAGMQEALLRAGMLPGDEGGGETDHAAAPASAPRGAPFTVPIRQTAF